MLRAWRNFGEGWKVGGILTLVAGEIWLVVVVIGGWLFGYLVLD